MGDDDEVAAVEDLADRWWTAVIAGDQAAVTALSAPGLRYVHSSAHVDTLESYLPAIVDGTFDYHAAERTEREGWRVGSTVLLTGRARTDVTVRGRDAQLDVRYTSTWVDLDGAWKLLVWHSTPVRH